MMPRIAGGSELAGAFSLDPEIDFLNHGSFGACPRAVLEAQSELRRELEREPVDFLHRGLPDRLDAARRGLAAFVGADAESLVPLSNATTGVNTVLRSLSFEKGDEILVTDHGYNACRNAVEFVAQRAGARVVVAGLPFPIEDEGQVVEAVLATVSPSTRLAVVDHVTSPTGLVLPIERLVRELDDRGIDTLVDGAHGPGMVDLDLEELGAAYYTGNAHKWVCAPKGAAFLFARGDRREELRPLTISHGANTRRPGRSLFHDEFDWVGTQDPTAFLCIPAAIETVGRLVPGGWPEVRRRNRELALTARAMLETALGIAPPAPDSMIGSLAALPLPLLQGDGDDATPGMDPLHEELRERFSLEVPVFLWPSPRRRLLRISAQLYNRPEQFRRLAEILSERL